MLESVDEINQKLAESELTPFQIDQLRHQDELYQTKAAELVKGFEPQLELLIENVLKATNLSPETKKAFEKSRVVKSKFSDGVENKVEYVPSILKEQPFPDPNTDTRIPLGDLSRILEAVGKDAVVLMNHRVYKDGTDEPVPDSQISFDTKYMMIRIPELPDTLLRVGVVNDQGQGKNILGADTKKLEQFNLAQKLSTDYSSSKTPNAKIFLFEAVAAKTSFKSVAK